MTRLVQLENLRTLQVIPGAPTIESATGLPADQIQKLTTRDKSVVWRAMRYE
jgi:hypothetical protein